MRGSGEAVALHVDAHVTVFCDKGTPVADDNYPDGPATTTLAGRSEPARSLLETSMYDWALCVDDVRYTGLDALLEYGRGFDSEKFRGCIFTFHVAGLPQ